MKSIAFSARRDGERHELAAGCRARRPEVGVARFNHGCAVCTVLTGGREFSIVRDTLEAGRALGRAERFFIRLGTANLGEASGHAASMAREEGVGFGVGTTSFCPLRRPPRRLETGLVEPSTQRASSLPP
jgi:hypothetical protein